MTYIVEYTYQLSISNTCNTIINVFKDYLHIKTQDYLHIKTHKISKKLPTIKIPE